MAKLRIGILQRGKGLALLARGRSIKSAAKYLQNKYHPQRSLEEVKTTYYPGRGFTRAIHLEGRPREEIATAFSRMVEMRAQSAKTGAETLNLRFQNPAERRKAAKRLEAKWRDVDYRRQMTQVSKTTMNQPENKAAAGQRMGSISRELWKKPKYRVARIKDARKTMLRSRADADFMAKQERAITAKWQEPEFRAKREDQGRELFLRFNQDPAFRAKSAKSSSAVLKALWATPTFRSSQSKKISAAMRALHADPHFRVLREARTKLRLHRRRLEHAVNWLEAQQPSGWKTETGGKQRRRVQIAVHVPNMEEAIDKARQMRKMLGVLPARQRVLLSHFFQIKMQHSEEAIREAQDLHPWEVKPELKAAMETLSQNPEWKKLLDEE